MNFNLNKNRIYLNWKDISWGYRNHIIGWKDVINYANDMIINGSSNQDVFELSMVNSSNIFELDDLLNKIAGSLENYSNAKWLYILLLQLYNIRNNIKDPLGEVETIYENFDYPEEIESFVRYMPVSNDYDPSKHTQEENEKRLYFNWKQYLDNQENIWK
ncbi:MULTISPECIES: DUF2247 family protein [unclassified Gilliamella]|nr:DUF2247 family protein [Gilliamella apicola]OCG35327.1 hypothetical protein A9G32_07210 [Gilliamella apicola]OCG46982.1 hypothetical protein A9G27_05955 [Gilliamella apicola]OCG48744.1 hypothetical protein A9G26_10045 [Gilliamella apicola]